LVVFVNVCVRHFEAIFSIETLWRIFYTRGHFDVFFP
jgi:hypothetical protein